MNDTCYASCRISGGNKQLIHLLVALRLTKSAIVTFDYCHNILSLSTQYWIELVSSEKYHEKAVSTSGKAREKSRNLRQLFWESSCIVLLNQPIFSMVDLPSYSRKTNKFYLRKLTNCGVRSTYYPIDPIWVKAFCTPVSVPTSGWCQCNTSSSQQWSLIIQIKVF